VIAHLRGVLAEKTADRVVLDVGGVGYLVQVSTSTLGALPPTGREAQLLIHAHQAQDAALALFGFASAEERELFELLISVHGVGPRLAQQILSGLELVELEAAISAGSAVRLRQVKGVGPKLAERIAVELRGKVRPPVRVAVVAGAGAPAGATQAAADGEGGGGANPDVVGALVGLGYRAAEAEKATFQASARLPGAAAAELLREALRQIQAR
jgi:Holliday junction DNA helicase RuvA